MENQKVDVVVAGGGLGGLFAAAELAVSGKKVVVLEKHFIPGGYASYFKRKGYYFETALHALNGLLSNGSTTERLFKRFNLFEKLEIFRLPEFYTAEWPDRAALVSDNYSDAQSDLIAQFPDEVPAIKKIFDKIKKTEYEVQSFSSLGSKKIALLPLLPFLYPNLLRGLMQSVGGYLDSVTSNEELKIALTANLHYFHSTPHKYGFLHFCAGQGSYFKGGATLLRGGSYQIVKALVEIISANGGEVRCNSEVEKIHSSCGAVVGVSYKDIKKSITQRVDCTAAVVNTPYPVFLNLLSDSDRVRCGKRYLSYTHSNSLFQVYFGLKYPLSKIGNNAYTRIFLPQEYKNLSSMPHINSADRYGDRIIDLADYSFLTNFEEGAYPTACAAVIDFADGWRGLSREDYLAKKLKHQEEIIDSIERRVPGFREAIAYVESATPLTFERYTGNPGGAVYGFSQDVKQVGPLRPKVKTPLGGLFLASAWSIPGGGMTAVGISGLAAAESALKWLNKRG